MKCKQFSCDLADEKVKNLGPPNVPPSLTEFETLEGAIKERCWTSLNARTDYVGGQVVPSKSEVGDANVIKDKAKLASASHKLLICPGADLNMTLSNRKLRNSIVGPSLVSR